MDQELSKKERKDLRRQEKQQGQEKRRQAKSAKRIVLWLSVIGFLGLVVWGIVFLVTSAPEIETEEGSSLPVVTELDRFKGQEDAQVVLVEYSDFQCPACVSFEPLLNQLQEEFEGQLKIVYRHFPLKSIHAQAELAAKAAEAAGLQGKFWEMHDILFERQREWSGDRNAKARFGLYADSLGLDIEQFEKDIDSDIVKDKVDNDTLGAQRANVRATPTFFLQGEKLSTPRNYEQFKSLISDAIEQNS